MIWRLALAAFLTLCLCVVGQSPRAQFNGCAAGFCNGAAPVVGGNVAHQDDCTAPTHTGNGQTSLTFNGLTISGGLTNSALRASIAFSDLTVTPTAVTAVWDSGASNQSMTLLNSATRNNSSVSVFGLLAPVSGNKTLLFSWASTTASVTGCADSWSGVNQTSIAVAFPNSVTANGNGTAPSVTITSTVGDAVAATHGSDLNPSAISVDHTQIYIDNAARAVSGSNWAVGAATVALGATLTGTGDWVSVGTSIKH